MNTQSYVRYLDFAALAREYPIGDDFMRLITSMSREELRKLQDERFRRCVALAWKTHFYRRLWGAKGLEPGDIRGLDDIGKLPTFDKSDIMDSIDRAPPFGDFHAMDAYPPQERPPVILHTTSGTTGRPQVLLFGPRGREIQNIILARNYLFQGLRADDIVHSVYGHGLINGGHYARESVTHWTRAIFMSAGTGIETRSATQVEVMRDFGATVIVGFADYIKRLSEVAREANIIPGCDIRIRMISAHIGREDRPALSQAWGGAEVFDWYGVGDTGTIAGEGADHAGLYVHEDAHYLELLDIDTGRPVEDGKTGDVVTTVLFKDDIYPMIRFNTHDVSAYRTDSSPIGATFRRIEGFLGRSDNMVKLRGINIFPQAIGAMMQERAEFAGEFICRAERDASGRDSMTVIVEVRRPAEATALLPIYRELLKRKIGIEVDVELVAPGKTAALTGIEARQKPIRLIDARKAKA